MSFLALMPWPAQARSTPVTECGMQVRGAAHLPASLDCSGHAGDTLNLQGRLTLNGFTLTGPADTAGTGEEHSAVDCLDNDSPCRLKIRGPGTIRGGFHTVTGRVVVVTDATVRDARDSGIVGARVKLRRAIVSENGTSAATVTGLRRCGIVAGKAVLKESTLNDNATCGADSGKISLRRATLLGNGEFDFRAIARPSGRSVFCDRSLTAEAGQSWGVCRLDGPPPLRSGTGN